VQTMIGTSQHESNSSERIMRRLMVWGALILFALGIWLLVEPVKARGAEFCPIDEDVSRGTSVVDNVVAVSARISMAAVVPGCR